jgi:hypothetical protein
MGADFAVAHTPQVKEQMSKANSRRMKAAFANVMAEVLVPGHCEMERRRRIQARPLKLMGAGPGRKEPVRFSAYEGA